MFSSQVFKISFIVILLSFVSLPSLEKENFSEDLVHRINAHLLLKDFHSAQTELHKGLVEHPGSKSLREMEMKISLHLGDEKAMFSQWKNLSSLYPEEWKNHELLEQLAWGVLRKGHVSSSPLMRAFSLIASSLSDSPNAVQLLHESMSDGNSGIREIAVQLAGEKRDEILCQDMLWILRHERNWHVRLAAIEAVGKMQIKEAAKSLKNVIGDERTTAEEKALSIQSLVALFDTVKREEIEQLIKSSRSGLRLLACELMATFDLHRDIDLLLQLRNDHHADVRKGMLQVMGILRASSKEDVSFENVAREMLNDSDIEVATTAAWLLTLHNPIQGQEAFSILLKDEKQEVRLLASTALCATGKYGFPLIQNAFHSLSDPFIRLNLALTMINQRVAEDDACQAIYEALCSDKGRWMWKKEGLFQALVPSDVRHHDSIPQYPEVVNQLVRLELIQILAFLHFPRAQEAMKSFLGNRLVDLSGMAAALLLTEGDDEALDLARALLQDSDKKIRVQSALILSLWGRDEKVISFLEKSYFEADRNLQEKILEGLGHIGALSSVPFLVDRLGESHQTLRIIAASSLIQCLNH